MHGPEPVGYEGLHRRAHEVAPVAVEEACRLVVEQDDQAVLVRDHHGVGGRLDEVPEARVERLRLEREAILSHVGPFEGETVRRHPAETTKE